MEDEPAAPSETKRSLDPDDWNAFRERAHQMLDAAIDHIENVRNRPVWTPVPNDVKKAIAEPLPVQAQGTDKVCEDLLTQVLPYATGNTHPRFSGWVHGAGAPGGIIADAMAAAMNYLF